MYKAIYVFNGKASLKKHSDFFALRNHILSLKINNPNAVSTWTIYNKEGKIVEQE